MPELRKFTLVRIRRPITNDVNEHLRWLGTSLGLFGLRDKDKSCFRLFIELLKSSKTKRELTSDDIAMRLNLSRGTVVHHLNRLMNAGIVVHEGKHYILRVDSLSLLVDEIKKDIERTLGDLKNIASEIDEYMKL